MHSTVSRPKILVVDNDKAVARELQLQLGAMGYELAGHVTHGEQAIALAGELRPDLVLMDVQLGGAVDGIAAAHAIRTQFSLPVVFLMAIADEETLARARLAEPFGYIRKPFSASVLGSVVELALNRHKTEAKLRQSEERLRLVLLGSRDGVWDRDLIKNEVYYSPRWFEMLGYADTELPSASDLSHRLMHPDDLDRATQFVAQVHAGEAAHYELEFRLRHKTGHYVPILSRGFVVRDVNGKAIRVGGTNTDLTARKRAEAKRWENEQRFRTIFEAEPECVMVLGPTGDLLEMNAAGLTMLETRSVEEARSHGLINFILPEYRADFGALHQRVMGGEPGLLEFKITGRRGTQRWLETHAAPMRDAEGRVTMLLGVTRDITERKQAAEQLRRSEENLAITLQSIGDAVIATDAAGLITRMNASAERLTGWPLADATGRPLPEVFCIVNAETRVPSINPVQHVMEGGEVVGLANHTVLRARDGREYQITDSAAPIRNPDGQTVGVVLVFSDVTEEYRIRQALANTTELLERTGEVAKVGGWELDLRTMKLFWSLETCRIHEIDPPVAPEFEHGLNLFVPAARPIIRAAMQAAIESGTPYDLELQKITAKGRPIWVRTQGFAVMEGGKAVKLRGAFHDITERKQTETALQQSDQRFRDLVDSTDGIVWEADATTFVFSFVSKNAQRLLGYPTTDWLQPGFWAGHIYPEDREKAVQYCAACTGQFEDHEFEYRFIAQDGRVVWLRDIVKVVEENGKPRWLRGLMLDVTERKLAQVALRESEERFRAVWECSADGMRLCDATGKIVSVNIAYGSMVGKSIEQLEGKSLAEAYSSEESERVLELFVRKVATRTIDEYSERELALWDGSKRWLGVSNSFLNSLSGPAFVLSIFRDITERKLGELALAAAQRRSAVLAELGRELGEATTPKAAAIHILEASQQLLRWDSGWLHLSDETQQNKVDLVNFDLIDGEIREVFPDMSGVQPPTRMARRVKEEGPQLLLRDAESDANADVPTYGSDRRSLSLMFVPIQLGGRFIGILSIQSYRHNAYDQADLELLQSLATHCAGALVRLQSSDALRASEERYRSLVEWSPEAIAVHRAGKVIYVNPVAIRMIGATSAQDLIGKPMLEWVHPDFHRIVLARMKTIAAGDHTPMIGLKYIKIDGTAIDVEVQSTSIVYDGAPAIHVAIRDVTERKQAEAAHVALESQLRESQKMEAIGTLAGGVAHDFNNILATIMGNVELARDDARANPRALESLEEIRKAGSRARDLVQQILSFSRRQPTERKLIALAPVVDESVRLLRTTLPSRIALDVYCEPNVPAVLANANQIEQALINLVNNAVFAMRGASGRVLIRLDTVMLDAAWAEAHPALLAMHIMRPGRTVRLSVNDDGLGMDAATLGRIFEPFFTTKAVDEGTGLGLSVVHGIVQAHEGAVEVESQPGKGSTFTLYLPISVETHSDPRPPDESAVNIAPIPAASGGQRILYIDDDESLVFLVQRLLERRGYRISGYTNQREALEALRGDPAAFDLVVTDYNMPGMSGLDVAREVRAIRADLPVAVASGFIDEALRAQAAEAGVRELICKANAVEDLCDAFVRLAQTVAKKSAGG